MSLKERFKTIHWVVFVYFKNDESVEMVQSPSNSTQNLKKRQSYEVTKDSDLENPVYATVKKPG